MHAYHIPIKNTKKYVCKNLSFPIKINWKKVKLEKKRNYLLDKELFVRGTKGPCWAVPQAAPQAFCPDHESKWPGHMEIGCERCFGLSCSLQESLMLRWLMKLAPGEVFIPQNCNSFFWEIYITFNTIVLVRTLGIYLSYNWILHF